VINDRQASVAANGLLGRGPRATAAVAPTRVAPYRTAMRNFIIRLFVNALALAAAAWLLDGIQLSGDFVDVLLVALVFGVLNALLKPILLLFSFPLLVLTLGLFALVVNALMLMLTARLLDSFSVSGFWTAVLGSIVISLVTMFLGGALKDGEKG
jgi:putative membrane protein